MLKRLLFIVLMGLSIGVSAQVSVKDAFHMIPDMLCPFLDKQQRFYMIMKAEFGELDTIDNRLNGKSTIISLTPQTLRVQIADGVEYGFMVQNDTITFVQTVCAPVCASIVKQYDREWHYLQTITAPIQGVFVEAMLQDTTIVYKDNTPELLDEDEKKAYQR